MAAEPSAPAAVAQPQAAGEPIAVVAPKPLFPAYEPKAKTTAAFPDLANMPELQSQLSSAKAKASANAKRPVPPSAAPKPAAALTKALPPKLDGMAPQSAPQVGPSAVADNMPISSTGITYKQGDRSVYVSITDTIRAAFMRDSVLSRLDRRGTADQGFIHGRFVKGQPAVVQFFPAQRSSQISVLVDNRYVVNVRVLGARSANDAQRIFESLPLYALGK